MKRLSLKKGLRSSFLGIPSTGLSTAPPPASVAVAPERIPHIKPRLLVREGHRVIIGAPLFEDKRDPRVTFLSPGAGTVESIRFGKRRVIQEVVIRLDRNEEIRPLGLLSGEALSRADRQTVVEKLLQGGLWPVIRQLPFRDYADPDEALPMAIVSLKPGDMMSPLPQVVLNGREEHFLTGLSVLEKLVPRIIVAAPVSGLDDLPQSIRSTVTHGVADRYPAGDPGVILYQIRTDVSENRACYVSGQDLADIGELFLTGTYPINRIHAASGRLAGERLPGHVAARRGSPLKAIAGTPLPGTKAITQSLFNGFSPLFDNAHMGSFESSVTLLDAEVPDELFGFVRPGMKKVSESRTVASRLVNRSLMPDAHLHGEERACINCGMCARICPVDLLPQFIMKAAMADELEEILAMGILDCTRCGLCAFVCPSKVELTQTITAAINSYYKDKS